MQDRQLLDPPPVLLEQPGVLDGHARLAGDRLHQREIAGAELSHARRPDDGEAADHPVLGDDRDEQLRAVRRPLADDRRQARIVGGVGGEHWPLGARRLLVQAVGGQGQPHIAQRAEPLRRHPVTRQRRQPLPGLVEHPQPDGVGVERVRDLPEEVAHQALHVERGRHRPGHRQQRLGLGQLALGLPGEVGVLHRQAHLGRHALDEPDLRRAEHAAGVPPDEEQAADGLAVGHRRGEQERVRRQRPGPLAVEARVGVHVAADHRAALLPGRQQRGELLEHQRPLGEEPQELSRHVVAGRRQQALAALVDEVDAHHVGAEGAAHLGRHPADRVIGRPRLREDDPSLPAAEEPDRLPLQVRGPLAADVRIQGRPGPHARRADDRPGVGPVGGDRGEIVTTN